MLTSRLCVIHCLPSAIRLEEYGVPDAFWACAERRCDDVPGHPNATLSAIDTTKIRICLVLCLTLSIKVLHRLPNEDTVARSSVILAFLNW